MAAPERTLFPRQSHNSPSGASSTTESKFRVAHQILNFHSWLRKQITLHRSRRKGIDSINSVQADISNDAVADRSNDVALLSGRHFVMQGIHDIQHERIFD
ncbi:hypothetical protein TNCV_4731001 [Trichonephila clavipes]|nr:hypothetical protein TNCV_4731001 [Trichonephila clavipes]